LQVYHGLHSPDSSFEPEPVPLIKNLPKWNADDSRSCEHHCRRVLPPSHVVTLLAPRQKSTDGDLYFYFHFQVCRRFASLDSSPLSQSRSIAFQWQTYMCKECTHLTSDITCVAMSGLVGKCGSAHDARGLVGAPALRAIYAAKLGSTVVANAF
jgi:hypothetical protein